MGRARARSGRGRDVLTQEREEEKARRVRKKEEKKGEKAATSEGGSKKREKRWEQGNTNVHIRPRQLIPCVERQACVFH